MKEKTKRILMQADGIYIDTCTLMNRKINDFLEDCCHFLKDNSRKLLVLKEVRLELLRLSESPEGTVRSAAMNALTQLEVYSDIFDVERSESGRQQMYDAFADPKLLAELMLYKQKYNLLLITNDKKLSMDALKLNNQQSCDGHPVTVAFVGYEGDLLTVMEPKKEEVVKPVEAIPEPIKEEAPPAEIEPEVIPKRGFSTGVAAVLTFIAGVLFEQKRELLFETAVGMYR